MVKIGEVEFLVKFDTVGKSFKDLITDAMGDVAGTDLADIENDIKQIRGYMGVLKTPFSGSYEIDLLKKKAYVNQLQDEESRKRITGRFAGSDVIMNYIKPGVKAGSEEALEIAAGRTEDIFARILDMMDKGFADAGAYTEWGGRIRKIFKILEATTETELNYLFPSLIGYIAKEKEIDAKIVKEILDKDATAIVTDAKGHFATIAKEIDQGGKEMVVKTEEDFQKALTKYLSIKNIGTIMTSQTIIFKGEIRKQIEEMVKNVKFDPTNFPVPKSLLRTIEDIFKLTGLVGDTKAPDVRAVFTNFKDVLEIVDKFHTEKTPEDVEKLKEALTEAFDLNKWVFLLWENAGKTSPRKLQKDKQPWNKWSVMSAAFIGTTGGGQIQSELLGLESSTIDIAKSIAEQDPDRTKKALLDGLEKLFNVMLATSDDVSGLPELMEEIKEKFSEGVKTIVE